MVLLRREADGPAVDGKLQRQLPEQDAPYLAFDYEVIRIWELSVELILEGGLGLLRLALLCDFPLERAPEVLRQMDARISQEADPSEAATLWAATFILTGLKFDQQIAMRFFEGVRAMRDSSTDQAILAEGEAKGKMEGRTEEARKLLLIVGSKRLGEPNEQIQSQIEEISDLLRLEKMLNQALVALTWDKIFD